MVFVSVIALLFMQTLPLHAHKPHDHPKQVDQMGMMDNHELHSRIHMVSTNVNDGMHSPAIEIDLSVEGIVKDLKFNGTLAVLAFFIILLIPLLASKKYWLINRETPFITSSIAFRPPLRAPPF